MGSHGETRVVNTINTINMNVDKEVFAAYAFYAGVVTVKMVAMSFLTARQRFATGVFISSEDATRPGMKTGVNENVERVRRAHQNDIENIIPFLFLGLLYIFTNPAYATALLAFRVFVGARILHTIVYLNIVPQPARALTFFVGVGVNLYLAYNIITHFM